MPSVDDRIVRMEFDNAAFERKIATTITSLDKLNKSLKFEGAQKGISDLSSNVGKFNFQSITDGIENVSKKFLALSTIAITVLAGITAKAVEMGAQLAKSLTLDNIIAGFKEYELNMNSIQTILANTKADGTNLQDVNAALDVLNEYSDKTIYNFGQMTKNIGTFTAAGVDLDTSVQSIKGISNLAAISGSSAEQASSAMYQLSQAVSTGTLRLIDWNSVVNAGMGGEVFQKALFETGKAMGTIKDVPITQTFEEWTDAGNTFRGSLEDNWLTADVLTTTLQGFTGEMTEAQLLSIGYTKEQAAQIMELGKTGVEAATKIRTFTQLLSTMKESIGSGWSQSFRLVIGDFEEATDLFTEIGGRLGGMVKESADARNKLLQGWKDLGGRDLLVYSLLAAFDRLMMILKPIKEAFREIFPPMTAERLYNITVRLSELANALEPSGETVENLKRIFKGFFGALEIGWTILKQGAKFIGELFTSLTGAGGGGFLDFAAKVGDVFTALNEVMVEGGGIAGFFTALTEAITSPIGALEKVKDLISDLFSSLKEDNPDKIGESFGRLGERFDTLSSIFDKVRATWEPIRGFLGKLLEVAQTVWGYVSGFLGDIGSAIAEAMEDADYDQIFDAFNTAFLGGIALAITRFVKSGFSFDALIGVGVGGGFFDKVGQSFEELTGVLSAMQQEIKSNTLLKIAGAVGILTASVVALSLIDSAALTKAMTAMSIGFGQLIGAFAIVSKMSVGPSGAASMTMLGISMTAFAAAILILSLAAESLADLDWDELARGLSGVAALMAIIVLAVIPLSKMSGSFIKTGIGMILIAVAIRLLANAVEKFADMSWGDMTKGLLGVAAGMILLGLAMKLMPSNMIFQGIGLLALAIALNILAAAVEKFASFSWTTMGKGFAGVAAGLVLIGLAMKLMPWYMPLIGAGLLLVSMALLKIADAMTVMGGMSWGEIAKGLTAMAASLLILAIGAQAMSGAIAGAIAIAVVSASMMLLAKVIKEFAKIEFTELLVGLAGIAAALAVLGIAAMLLQPALGPMMLLGAALLLIGAGFALFGLGASLVAEAFERLAVSGEKGSKAFVKALQNMGKAIPALATGLAQGFLEFLDIVLAALPGIISKLGPALGVLLDELTKLLPKAGKLIRTLLDELLKIIREFIPQIALLGVDLLLGLLQGIRDNIGEIVTVVGEIITEFLTAFSEQLTGIVQAVADLITTFFTDVATAVGEVAGTLMVGVGTSFIQGFLDGMGLDADAIFQWVEDFITDIIDTVMEFLGINSPSTVFRDIGKDLITGFFNGIKTAAVAVTRWFTSLAGDIIRWVGDMARTLWNKGWQLITGLYNGLIETIGTVSSWLGRLPGSIASWVGNMLSVLWDKGRQVIQGLQNGITSLWSTVSGWLGDLPSKISGAVGNLLSVLWGAGRQVIQGLWNGLKSLWNDVSGWFGDRIEDLKNIPIVGGLVSSPSKIYKQYGMWIMEGLAQGLAADTTVDKAMNNVMDTLTNGFTNSITAVTESLGDMTEFSPTITPVLDLTNVQTEAKKIADYIKTGQLIVPTFSTNQANVIATSGASFDQDDPIKAPAGSGEVKFEQNIYAPKQLSTEDIYRQTRNQITMAKQELSIP